MNLKKFFLSIILLSLIGITASAEHQGYIVKFKTLPHTFDSSRFEEIHAPSKIYAVDSMDVLNGYDEHIDYVEENTVVKLDPPEDSLNLMTLPDDDQYPTQWWLQMINADYAWQHESYGNDVRVAVIDSGCYPHSDLDGNILTGWNFLTSNTDVTDNIGHGSHVCGIIASSINSSGVVGVAPKAKIVPLKCFDNNYTTTLKILEKAIYAAVDDYGCKVINMSWGNASISKDFKLAIDYAAEKDVLLVASVGNSGTTSKFYPAALENVIGVGSVDINKNKSSFSQYNTSVNIVAPGNSILSTSNTGSYVKKNGTSMAAPHICGMAALAFSIEPALTPYGFTQLLYDTAEDLGTEGYDTYYGYGLADTKALVDELMKTIPCYVSPINEDADRNYVLIKNNTSSVLSGQSLFAKFTSDKYDSIASTDIKLLPGKSAILKSPDGNYNNHFLWSGISKLKPLAQKRERLN